MVVGQTYNSSIYRPINRIQKSVLLWLLHVDCSSVFPDIYPELSPV